jgi:hypothetical protein
LCKTTINEAIVQFGKPIVASLLKAIQTLVQTKDMKHLASIFWGVKSKWQFHINRNFEISLWKSQDKVYTLGWETVNFATAKSKQTLAQLTTGA